MASPELEPDAPVADVNTYLGVCIDDGTGRGAFFLGNDGKVSHGKLCVLVEVL